MQEIAREAGAYIRNERKAFDHTTIESKGRNNFVTHVDKNSEQMLVNALAPLLPGAGFITEEDDTRERSADYNWVIDPLDGTTNFIHGIPCYCVSIGLVSGNESVLGVIYEVNMDECFYAWKGGGAWLNGKKIRVAATKSLSESVVATGFPYDVGTHSHAYVQVLSELLKTVRGLRRIGAAAVDMAYVACGRFDAFYESGINAWDVAAGSILVQEAGGKVSDFKNGTDFIFGRQIICGPEEVTGELSLIMEKHFS